MKKRLFPAAMILILLLSLTGCGISLGLRRDIKAKGELSQKKEEGSADKLTIKNIYIKIGSVSQGPKVELLKDGGAARVEIQAQESVLEAIKITFAGQKLTVSASANRCYVTTEEVMIRLYNYSFEELTFAGACQVTDSAGLGREGKDLKIDLSGASTLTSDAIRAKTFTADLSGASRLEGKELRADSMKLDLSGASSLHCVDAAVAKDCVWDLSGASGLEMAGSGQDLKADISGASRAKCLDFQAESGKVNVSGASTLEGSFSGSLSGDVSGASHLCYQGDPSVDVKVSGASNVEKR